MAGKLSYEELGQIIDALNKELADCWCRNEICERTKKEIINCIISALPVGICLAENRMIKRANDTMLEMFGLEKKDDFVGKSTRILYPSQEEYKRVGQIIYNNLKADKVVHIDTEFKRKDGSTFWGHLKISWIDPSSPMKMTVATISDISWRKLAEQERLEKEKTQSTLEIAGTICEALNQPLQVILGYAELLIMNISKEHSQYEKLKGIIEQIDRITEITRKLMNITRYGTKDYIKGENIVDINKASI